MPEHPLPLTAAAAESPEVLSAVVDRLAVLAPDRSRDELSESARDLLRAALAAVPSRETQLERLRRSRLEAELATEADLPEEERWRSRTLRVCLTVLEIVGDSGVDTSAVLSGVGGPEGAGDAFEALLRGVWGAAYDHDDVDLTAPTSWSEGFVDSALEHSAFWVDHYRSINSVVEGWSLPEPTSRALWDAPGWEGLYRSAVPVLLSSVLHPDGLSDEEWEEFLYSDLDELQELQAALLARLGPDDLALAGVERTPEGRFTNLLGDD